MIKRNYFMSTEIHFDNGKITKSWRTYSYKSLKNDYFNVISEMVKQIADKNEVDESKVIVINFNRV